MKARSTRSGFIMVLTLMVTALATILVSYLLNRSSVFIPVAKVMTDREKAQQLALGGIQLAMSRLAYADVQEKGKAEAPQAQQQQQSQQQGNQPQPPAPKDSGEKQMLESLLPYLNRWQKFTFDRAKDGFEGTIEIYIACEEGKININEIYDFSKHAFVGKQDAVKNVLKIVFENIRKEIGGENILESFEKFLKNKNFKLQDVTDLLTLKAFEPFKDRLFYASDDIADSKKRPIYLTDIFTIWSQSATVDPWLLSESLSVILGLKSSLPRGGQKDKADIFKGAKEKITPLLKEFKAQHTWPADWNKGLNKLYEKEFNALPKGIESLFGSTFGPHIFSVISYGTVGKISHRLFAIVELDRVNSDRENPAAVSLKKLYWI